MGFQVQPDVRNTNAPAGLWGAFAQQHTYPHHTCEGEDTPDLHIQQLRFGQGLPESRDCSGTPWGCSMGHSQCNSPQHGLIWVQGRAQAADLVRGDSKHQEAASHLTSKAHGQVSLHSPEQLQKHLQLQPLLVPSVPALPYKGLLEYCWMSRWWQGLHTRSGLMLDGRGSSCAEQASQKVPPQFLQMFWKAGKGQKARRGSGLGRPTRGKTNTELRKGRSC